LAPVFDNLNPKSAASSRCAPEESLWLYCFVTQNALRDFVPKLQPKIWQKAYFRSVMPQKNNPFCPFG